MLTKIAIILIVLWFLGLITRTSVGPFFHILLVAAVVLFILHMVMDRNTFS